jgi:poly(3-hydroxyalkanoate) synthetase
VKLKKLNHEPYQDVVAQVDSNALKLLSFQIGTFGTEVTTRPNPPGGKGGTFWTQKPDDAADTAREWRAAAECHDGSWWTDWAAWLGSRAGDQAAPPTLGSAANPALCDAPGLYVVEK